MKKIWLIILCALLAVACAQEEMEITGAGSDGNMPVQLFSEINQLTRARINDEGFCNGDAVGVYVVNYTNGNPGQLNVSGNQADNVKYTFDEATGKWTPSIPVYYLDKTTHVDIYGYYPYNNPSSVSEYAFEVLKDQSKDATNGNISTYEASDFLWAKAENIVPSKSAIPLVFRHMMSGVMVTLVEGTGFSSGEFEAASKSVLVTNTVRTANINLKTGEVSASGEMPETGIIPVKYQGDFRAIVVPQTLPAQTALFSITIDGLPYSFRKDEVMEYSAGRLHKFTISVSKKSESGLEFTLLNEAITPWEADNLSHDGLAREYVIIHCPTAGKLKETIVSQGKDFTKIQNLKVTGRITTSDYYFMRDEMSLLQNLNLKEVESICDGQKCIPSSAFEGKSSILRCVMPDDIVELGYRAFTGTNLSGSLIIPEGVKLISGSCFASCPINGSLSLPSTLEEVGEAAFYDCREMTGTLSLPAKLKKIGNSAFANCKSLTGNLILPPDLEELVGGCFSGCSGLTGSLTIPNKITRLDGNTFSDCTGLDGELKLPSNITEIGGNAFAGCKFRYPIVLPESLTVIGYRAFDGCQFSGTLVLPHNLTVLGDYAFRGNNRMTGKLEIPESLLRIPTSCFEKCGQFDELVLPKSIESVGNNAFSNCFQLISITSLAVTPPTITSTSFAGVGKDNMAVEVPEVSLNDYITAPNWNEFKRFSAHREFSVSRRLFRALNGEYSKELIIRSPAEQSWSVENKPDWISVSPDHGTGDTEITLTTARLPRYSGNREGEIVFLMDGKDYRVRTKVEQYDYEYGDGDVITNLTHTKGSGVNIVFLGDCFDAKDITEGKYIDGINEAIGYFFDIEPYKTYKDYFNVYTVIGMSSDSGVGSVNTIRDSRFGAQYTLETTPVAPDMQACFDAACLAPINGDVSRTLIVIIENSEEYGGVCFLNTDGSAIAVCPMSRDLYPYDFRGVVQHEAGGHGFGKLADEYIYHNAFATACDICGDYLLIKSYYAIKSLGWYENIHHSGKLHDVPWYDLMFDPDYKATVDIYEGAFVHSRGIFRSEPTSCMNNHIPYFSAISRESIVKRILDYAGEEFTFDGFKEKDVRTAAPTKSGITYEFGSDIYAPSHHHAHVIIGD